MPRNTQYPPNQQQPQYPPNQQQPQFPPFTSPNPPMSILIVITRVNNTRTGIGVRGSNNTTQLPVVTAPSSFSEVVTNAYANPDGYTLAYHYIRGSQMAININFSLVFSLYLTKALIITEPLIMHLLLLAINHHYHYIRQLIQVIVVIPHQLQAM